jgi:hypothetical protein
MQKYNSEPKQFKTKGKNEEDEEKERDSLFKPSCFLSFPFFFFFFFFLSLFLCAGRGGDPRFLKV